MADAQEDVPGGRVIGLLLAAGAGRRMGRPKALLRGPDGEPWVARAVRVLRAGGCDPVLVVLGAGAEQAAPLVPAPARVVLAEDWAEGMGASLRAGLRALQALPALPADRSEPAPEDASEPAPAALVCLVDTPGVGPEVVARLAALAGPDVLARAAYRGRPGHPVLLGRRHWAGVLDQARGDAGARGYLAARAVTDVECGDIGSGTDLDSPDDLGAYPGAVSTQVRPDPEQAHPALAPEHVHAPRQHDTSRLRPPARRVVLTEVTDQPLDAAAHEAAVAEGSSGAVVTFHGLVRDHDGGRGVTGIEYVGHPTAAATLAEVVAEVTGRSDCEAVAVSHRVGELAVGDLAIVVAVASAHRQEAFATAAELVDEVKHRLPVWKRQQFPDGTDEWVACP